MTTRRCRTRNTEYLLVDGCCVAVLDLQTGRRRRRHGALGQRLYGCVHPLDGGQLSAAEGPLRPGVCLWFRAAGHDVLTTPLVEVLG